MCYDSGAQPPTPPTKGQRASGQDLVLTTSDGNRFSAYLAVPSQPRGQQVIIFPDIRGLHQFYKDLARRLAEQGITALALDYFGRSAGLTARDDQFEFAPHVQKLHFDTFQSDVRAARDHLRSLPGGDASVFTLGFCMGGSLSLLTGTQDLGLAGVVAFYAGFSRSFVGIGTALERAREVRYPVLGLFGGADQGIPPHQVQALDQALDEAGVEHEIVTYPGAPHGFFDRRAKENAEASADAWRRVLGFLRQYSQASTPAS